ncbi:hypothetical protein FIM02_01275 [SAR202 cluster bacterium AD-802-E10_MRT_200m]|nr:hypothetical protein [SAR202 cluster bacterium AD-802-E10_MRT_200m]MQF82777.1 hypothetical protein [SAR202 cluster bacterium AD-802-E10_MRT_200m]
MTLTSNTPDIARAADVLVHDYMSIQPHENVIITADTDTDPSVIQSIFTSVETLGARAVVITTRKLPFQGSLADPFIPNIISELTMNCDVWIDLTFPYFAGSTFHDNTMKLGKARYLLGGDMGRGGLVRLFGKVDLDKYFEVHQGFDRIIAESEGKECHITNNQGTNVRFRIGKPGYTKPRKASKPGMYLVPGACTIFPQEETVTGKIVVDSVFHEYYTHLPEPLILNVEGKIKNLEGGGSERKVMDRALRRAGGGTYGYVIHFTYGIHPAARQTEPSFVEAMRVQGANSVGLGLPWWNPGGGENHPDAILSTQSIMIDGNKFVEEGIIVSPEELTIMAQHLEPLFFS